MYPVIYKNYAYRVLGNAACDGFSMVNNLFKNLLKPPSPFEPKFG